MAIVVKVLLEVKNVNDVLIVMGLVKWFIIFDYIVWGLFVFS